jgi:hypothetical protein
MPCTQTEEEEKEEEEKEEDPSATSSAKCGKWCTSRNLRVWA